MRTTGSDSTSTPPAATSGGEKGALLEGDPRGAIAAELRVEHEPERRRQVGGGLLAGQLHQPSRQITQSPRGKIWKNRGRRDMGERLQTLMLDGGFHPPIIAK